jgi:EAL domain
MPRPLWQSLDRFLRRKVRAWRPLRHWPLRPKVMLAFVVISAMSALCGIVGLVFVNRINTTVSAFVDVTSPLLVEGFALAGDNVKTGEISTCEALLRWRHPERGLVQPGEFIPLAEEIGFINQLGSWALSRGCADARDWPEQVKLSVNLSPVQFKSGALVGDVTAALNSSGLAPGRLELEITESVMLMDTEATLTTLTQLRALGAHISMDDFGTGYSSLGYLRKFPSTRSKSISRPFAISPTSRIPSPSSARWQGSPIRSASRPPQRAWRLKLSSGRSGRRAARRRRAICSAGLSRPRICCRYSKSVARPFMRSHRYV